MSVIDRSANIHRLLQQLRQFARYSLGRVVGTTSTTSGRYRWFLDNQERSLVMRAEINALTELLLRKGVFSRAEFQEATETEFEAAIADQRKLWPEVTPAHDGRSFSLDAKGFAERCKTEEWPP